MDNNHNYSPLFFLIAGLLLVLFFGLIDAVTSQELYISIFYLIPIALVTWNTGKWSGVGIALTSAAAWFINDYLSGALFASFPVVLWNATVRLNFFLIIAYLLALLKNKLDMEMRLARVDPLTRITNRRHFYELAQLEIHRSNRYKKQFTVAYIDLDNFKQVNDRFGHHVGDIVLIVVAGVIEANLRKSDTVSRLGGDEFIILLPETGSGAARWVIFRVQKLLLSTMEERGWPVTFSIGVVTFTCAPFSVDEILEKVDNTMYISKRSGKNQITYDTYCSKPENTP